ncbi:hypothetical protein UFOVP1613_28 [uncultured Caudovirales phage]|uniref:Uncharacterized protein n=1 Tax=uncultured Caudovirales phage TaxID=2100421 RepID=A0A6J5QYE1_9CAUD|nr:hypothetical protein UFOVP1163_30 [uncultured Caudovirales phage]CAB4219287.1 hypothetical protein UFOVP1613_28 [uncultured Caudovirales phage]
MVEQQNSGASFACILERERLLRKSTTSGDSGASETMPPSYPYVLSIIEATREYMGLEQKALRSDTESIKNSYSLSLPN